MMTNPSHSISVDVRSANATDMPVLLPSRSKVLKKGGAVLISINKSDRFFLFLRRIPVVRCCASAPYLAGSWFYSIFIQKMTCPTKGI